MKRWLFIVCNDNVPNHISVHDSEQGAMLAEGIYCRERWATVCQGKPPLSDDDLVSEYSANSGEDTYLWECDIPA